VQEDILNENPTATIAVHVIWFSVLGGDQRSEIRTELVDDPRAMHNWDDDREISAFFGDHAEELGLPSSGSSGTRICFSRLGLPGRTLRIR